MGEIYVDTYNTVFEIVSTEMYSDEGMSTAVLYGQHTETGSICIYR